MARSRALQRGFTLIELMIVVAIIGMLASVALPAFGRYQLRAKQAERESLMAAVQAAMNDLYIRDAKFPNGAGAMTWLSLPQNPVGNPGPAKRPLNLTAAYGDWSALSITIQGQVYYSYTGLAITNLFGPGTRYHMISATGDLDGDGLRPTKSDFWRYQNDVPLSGWNPLTQDDALLAGFEGSF